MAPIARDESFYDIASKSPSTASCYDNEYSPNSGKFKGFPYIDGAPRKQQSVSCGSNGNAAAAASNGSHKDTTVLSTQNNNFSLLVDKSTQTQELEKRSKMAKEACAIL